jgi:hypothetical protein
MAKIVKKVEAKPTGLFLKLLPVGSSAKPAPVTITVGALGAAVGANQIPIADPGQLISINTILVFEPAGANLKVVVTEDFVPGAAGNLKVEMYEGIEGAGLTAALVAGDTADWDGLYTATGTENAPFSNNPSSQDLQATTFGPSSSVSVSNPKVTSVAPRIARSGLFIAEEQLTKDILMYADKNRNFWCKQILPDAEGQTWLTRQGPCTLTGLQNEPPADGLIRMSFDINFKSIPEPEFA